MFIQPVCGHIICADLDRCAFTEQPTRPAVECGICHETRPPATWCPDPEVGSYAVCAVCR